MRAARNLALGLCLLLGWTTVQRGLFHRCAHVTFQGQGVPVVPAVKGICPVCDVMLPVFNTSTSTEVVMLTTVLAEIGVSYISAERFGSSATLPGRGPPRSVA